MIKDNLIMQYTLYMYIKRDMSVYVIVRFLFFLLGPAIIQWSYRYSCWKLFALEIDTFLESVGSGTGEKIYM